MNKKKILRFIPLMLILFLAFNITGTQKNIISDTAVTLTNDTITSGWVNIGSSQNVALFYTGSDSGWVKGTFDYRYGTSTEISNLAADTLSIDRRNTTTGLSKGKVLRGYGLATDLIPGANQIKVTFIRSDTMTLRTTSVNVGLIAE